MVCFVFVFGNDILAFSGNGSVYEGGINVFVVEEGSLWCAGLGGGRTGSFLWRAAGCSPSG